MQNNTTIKPLNQNKMEAKEKAKELVDKMYSQTPVRKKDKHIKQDYNTSIQCALIAVDEIINIIDAEDQFILYNYWQEVKQEIDKL